MHDEALQTLPELLLVAGIDDCILIGHSDGASISLIYAGGTPALPLRAIITAAPHVFCEDVCVDSIQRIAQEYLTTDLRDRMLKYHGGNTDCAFRGWADTWLHPEFRHWNLEQYLRPIETPLLIIQGEDDQYGTIAQVETIKRQVSGPVQTVILPHCNHSTHRDQPGATLQAMSDFITQLLE